MSNTEPTIDEMLASGRREAARRFIPFEFKTADPVVLPVWTAEERQKKMEDGWRRTMERQRWERIAKCRCIWCKTRMLFRCTAHK